MDATTPPDILTVRPRSRADENPHVPARVAIYSILGFWFAYFMLNTFRTALEGAEEQGGMLLRRTVVTLIGMGLSGLLCLVLRRVDRRPMSVMIATAFVASIPVCIAYATINYMAFYVVQPLDSVKKETEMYAAKHLNPMMGISDSAASWYFFIASWAVLYVALSYAARVRVAERNAARFQAEAQTAQLRALRYQINPHFLFNTLNSLSTLVLRQRSDEAERMIMTLSNFFRTSLTADPTENVPLADEIRMQRLYLDIEQVRFPDRLIVEIAVPEALEDARVPGMILQPLVENAIKYGVAATTGPVTIAIRAMQEGGDLRITVENDGTALSAAQPGHGIGLRNVAERLRTRFGDAARCRYGARQGGGFQVELTLPLSRDD